MLARSSPQPFASSPLAATSFKFGIKSSREALNPELTAPRGSMPCESAVSVERELSNCHTACAMQGDTTLFVENLMHSVALQDLQIEDGLSEDAVNLILHVVSRMWSNSGALKRIQLIANRIIVDWDDWRVWDGEKALSLHPRELVEMHIDALREHLPQYSGCRVMIFHDSSSMKIVSSDRDVCGMSFNDGEVQVDSAYWVKIAIRRGEKPNVRTEGEAKAANGSSVSLAARQGSWQQLRSELLRRKCDSFHAIVSLTSKVRRFQCFHVHGLD